MRGHKEYWGLGIPTPLFLPWVLKQLRYIHKSDRWEWAINWTGVGFQCVATTGFLILHDWIRRQITDLPLAGLDTLCLSHRATPYCTAMEEKIGRGQPTPKSRAWMALSHSWSGPPSRVNNHIIHSGQSQWGGAETERARIPPKFYPPGNLYGDVEIWGLGEDSFPLNSEESPSLLVTGKRGSEDVFPQLFLPPMWLSWRETSVAAAYDFVNFVIPHPLLNSPPCGLQIVRLKNEMCFLSYEIQTIVRMLALFALWCNPFTAFGLLSFSVGSPSGPSVRQPHLGSRSPVEGHWETRADGNFVISCHGCLVLSIVLSKATRPSVPFCILIAGSDFSVQKHFPCSQF